MIFSVHHLSHFKSYANEIQCPYNQLGLIIDFIKKYPEKRYNIIIPEELTET